MLNGIGVFVNSGAMVHFVIGHFQRGCDPKHGVNLIVNVVHHLLRHLDRPHPLLRVRVWLLLNLVHTRIGINHIFLKIIVELVQDVFENISLNRL